MIQCKSGSLYFLHKLLNETAYLRSMKSPRMGITAFFVSPTVGNRPTSERLMVERYHSEANPLLFVKSCFLIQTIVARFYSGNDVHQMVSLSSLMINFL